MSDIMVSILCAAYNHEKYIRDALEGFVNQKTNFKYEVLINDDCSTDNTASIIKEYELKYPDIIKPIYQTENQYSKGVGITKDILIHMAKGKYISFCEGDDYWIDENKLQMQYEYMEEHSDCTFCFSNAKAFDYATNKTSNFLNEIIHVDCINFDVNNKLSIEDMLKIAFVPTASFFFPNENYKKYPAEFYDFCAGGDRQIVLYSTLLGYAHYIDKQMVVYRINVPNSATTKWKTFNPQQTYRVYNSFINLYNNIDKLTDKKYHDAIDQLINELKICILKSNYREFRKDKNYYDAYKLSTKLDKLKMIANAYFPHVTLLLRRIRSIRKKK